MMSDEYYMDPKTMFEKEGKDFEGVCCCKGFGETFKVEKVIDGSFGSDGSDDKLVDEIDCDVGGGDCEERRISEGVLVDRFDDTVGL
jgi:hypothetical protein